MKKLTLKCLELDTGCDMVNYFGEDYRLKPLTPIAQEKFDSAVYRLAKEIDSGNLCSVYTEYERLRDALANTFKAIETQFYFITDSTGRSMNLCTEVDVDYNQYKVLLRTHRGGDLQGQYAAAYRDSGRFEGLDVRFAFTEILGTLREPLVTSVTVLEPSYE